MRQTRQIALYIFVERTKRIRCVLDNFPLTNTQKRKLSHLHLHFYFLVSAASFPATNTFNLKFSIILMIPMR